METKKNKTWAELFRETNSSWLELCRKLIEGPTEEERRQWLDEIFADNKKENQEEQDV